MEDQISIQKESNNENLSVLEAMIGKESPRLIRDRFNQISDIIDNKHPLDIVEYLEIKDLLNSNKSILKKDGKDNLTQYQTEKIDAYKRLDEQLNAFSNFEDTIGPELSNILSKKGSYRYWDNRIDAIQKYVSSKDANDDMIRYFSDYVGNAINSFTKKDGTLKARKDPDTFNKLKELKKDISCILYNRSNTNSHDDSTIITGMNTDDRLEYKVEKNNEFIKDATLEEEEDPYEILAGQTKMGIFKKGLRRLVDGAIGHLNGHYNVNDVYSKRTIEIAKSLGEYDKLQEFTIELNNNAKNAKEAIAYIKKVDEERGFSYTPEIKKINLHSKYKIQNSEEREKIFFGTKDYFSWATRLKAFLNKRKDELISLAGDFNNAYQRSVDNNRTKIDKIAELSSQIGLYNKMGEYGKIFRARLPPALM